MIEFQPKQFRVALLAKQTIIGRALCHLLASDKDLNVLPGKANIDELSLAKQRPDLLLVDLDKFDEIDGIVASCRRASPQTKIAVLTSSDAQSSMRRALACGVDGYIFKGVLPAEFIRACKMLACGEIYFDPCVAGALLQRLRIGEPTKDELSTRES